MEVAVADSFVQEAQPFVDGLGERRVIVDARGERLDVLRLNSTLSATPSFEAALRERAGRVAGFRHESYSRVRTVKSTGRPALCSSSPTTFEGLGSQSCLPARKNERSPPRFRPLAA